MWLSFFLCSLFHILQAVFSWPFRLLSFAPFLAFACLKCKGKASLWAAMLAGLFVDLLSDDPFGVHAMSYVLSAGVLQKVHFKLSHEEPLHLSLYTVAFSFSLTLAQLFLLFLFDRRVPLDGQWTLIDIFCMPLADGIYAYLWLGVPWHLYRSLRHTWGIYWLKKKKISPSSH